MRYRIKPAAVSKINRWILQAVLRYNQTTSPFVKGNSFWSTRVTRNSTIKIVATVNCDTLINKTLHVKRTRYTTFRDATPISRFYTRLYFFFFCRNNVFEFTRNIPAFATCIPKGAYMSRVTITLSLHFDASRHRKSRVDDVMCIKSFILEYCT